jgi:hypothetical protein
MSKLTLDDISDLRAYERERDDIRRDVIDLKRKRRVALGEVVTLVFENAQTVRFQVQEMARAETLTTDAAIESELATYNPLVPEPGQLCVTLFIELTTDEQLQKWLPRLVGIERSLVLWLPGGELVRCVVDKDHDKQLTREDVTAAVHYVRWELTPEQVEDFGQGTVSLVADHPDYAAAVDLDPDTLTELLGDLRHGG